MLFEWIRSTPRASELVLTYSTLPPPLPATVSFALVTVIRLNEWADIRSVAARLLLVQWSSLRADLSEVKWSFVSLTEQNRRHYVAAEVEYFLFSFSFLFFISRDNAGQTTIK